MFGLVLIWATGQLLTTYNDNPRCTRSSGVYPHPGQARTLEMGKQEASPKTSFGSNFGGRHH